MAKEMYKQCTLSKETDQGTAYMVSWIRSRLAVAGKILDRLEDSDTGIIESGWKVVSVTDPEVEEHIVLSRSRDFKKTRKASDV